MCLVRPKDCSNVWAVGVGLMSCSMTSVTPQDRLRETDWDKQEDRVTTSLWFVIHSLPLYLSDAAPNVFQSKKSQNNSETHSFIMFI